MTWQTVRQDNARQQQIASRMNPQDLSVEETITQTWLAATTNTAATVVDAQTASDGTGAIPTKGQYYTVSGGAWFLCVYVFPKQVGPGQFEVQVEYYRKIAYQPPGKQKWSANIAFSGVKFSEKAHKDAYGRAYVNSAGVSFDPGVMREYQDEKFDLTYKTVSPPDLRGYRSMVNSSAVTFNIAGVSRSYLARQLKLDDATMSTTVTLGDGPNTPVWDVRLSFTSRTVGANGAVDGYVDRILDEGKERINGHGPAKGGGVNDAGLSYASLLTALAAGPTAGTATKPVTKLMDPNGNFYDAPQPLDGTGIPLAINATPVFLAFAREYATDLNPLFQGF